MRIGLFTDTYIPQINGVATSVLMLKKHLADLGHFVVVFTTTDPLASPEENVYRLPSLPFTSERRVALLYHPRTAEAIRAMELDVIHTHTEFSLGTFGRRMARELGIPHIHTMHTIYEDYTHFILKFETLNPVARSVARSLSVNYCNSADSVIVPTSKVSTLLAGYGVEKGISIVPTGVELERYAPGRYNEAETAKLRAELGIIESAKVLLYLGRISHEKNIGEILDHLADYLPKHPDTVLLLVGDGPAREDLAEQARQLGIAEQVIFAGARPWSEIGRYYQLGDVFVSASQSETQGLTYIEALAAGLPVVAKDDPCLDDVICQGSNGYTFNDATGFACALDAVIQDVQLENSMSTAAMQSACRFSATQYACSVQRLYQHAVNEKLAYLAAV